MMQGYSSPGEDDPDLSEVCLVGGDLTEFTTKRIGVGLRKIDLSFNSIQRLKGLETSADTLEEVIVDNNQLHRMELRGSFPKLHTLSLNKNLISDFSPLLNTLTRCAPALRYLSLLGNPACPDQLTADDVDETDYYHYRLFIIHHLPGLRFLDHRPITKLEYFEAKRLQQIDFTFQQSTPLPPSRGVEGGKKSPVTGTGKGKQGKRKYKYVGKNSEGNRFIKDVDL